MARVSHLTGNAMTSKAYRENFAAIQWGPIPEWRKRPQIDARRGLHVIPDIEPYRSPIDGKVVSGRRQHRDHMRAHEVIEVGNEKPKPFTPKPRPPIAEDIRASYEMLKQGYRPGPLGHYNPGEFE